MGMGFMTWLVITGSAPPQESETGEERLLHGGSWYDPSNSLRQSNRFYVRYPRVSMCS